MVRNYLFLFLFISFFSCSQDSDLTTNNDSTQVATSTLRSADGKYRYLGFSYDVTGDNLSKKSVRRPVIDIDRMDAETKHTLINDPETGGENHFYYGYSSFDYVKEVSRKTGFSATASGIDLDKLGLCGFSGNLNYNKEFDSKYSYSSKYSFATADITKYVNTFRIEDNLSTLLKYLSPKFLSDLNSTSFNADQFVLDYGTHVLTDITMGGHLQIIYRSSIIDESDYTRKKEIVKAGLNGTLKKIGLSANIDKETEIKETLTTQNKEATVYIKYKAGTGVGGTYNVETGVPTVDKGAWEQSVTIQNAGLVEINWSKAYPLYDFITDINKKNAVKNAITRYVKSKQLEIIEIMPLCGYYSGKAKDHYMTTNWLELGSGKDGYNFEKIIGYIHSTQVSGTIPLYGYYSGKAKDHYATTNWLELGSGKDGYTFEKIIGYVFSTQASGTIPLYGYYSGNAKDHYVTNNLSELGSGKDGYGFEKIMYYTFPAK